MYRRSFRPLQTVLSVGLLCAGALAQGDAAPGDPVRVLAQELATWRVDTLTLDDGREALELLSILVERGEVLLDQEPEDAARVTLLGELYAADLARLERVGATRERALRIGGLGELALAALRTGDAARVARGRAAAAALEGGVLEWLLGDLLRARVLAGDGEEQVLLLTVDEALRGGEAQFLGRLGSEAIAPLSSLALRPVDRLPQQGALDPLVVLAQLDPAAALDVGLRLVDELGALGRARMLEAYSTWNPFAQDEVWVKDGERQRLRDPLWVRVIVGAADSDAGGDPELSRMLSEFALRDYAPEGIAELLPEWVLGGYGSIDPPTEVMLAAARELLGRGDEESVRAAAPVLVRGPDVAALWAVEAVEESTLRWTFLRAFGPRLINLRLETGSLRTVEVLPEPDEAYIGALERFMAVESDEMAMHSLAGAAAAAGKRGRALVSGPRLAGWIPAGSALIETGWTGAFVLHALLLEEEPRHEFFRRLLDAAPADDVAPAVLNALLRALAIEAGPVPMRKVLDECLAPELEGAALQALANIVPSYCELDLVGYEPLIRRLVVNAPLDVLRYFIEQVRTEQLGIQHRAFLGDLPPALLVELVRSLSRLDYDGFQRLTDEELPLPPATWLQLAEEPGHSVEVRQWLLKRLGEAQGPDLSAADTARLAAAMVLAEDSVLGSSPVAELGLDPQQLLGELLDAANAPDALIEGFSVPLTDEVLVDRLLLRLPPESWGAADSNWQHRGLLRALVRRADAALNETLLTANRPGTFLQELLLEALEVHGTGVHLPVAGALLDSGNFRDSMVRERAVALVGSYMNDEAAEFLLRAGRTWRDERGRELLRVELERLLAWKEAERRWAAGREVGEARAIAIRELVVMLDAEGSERHVDAVRGLAALGALDQLPRLIELLEDGSVEVREAARAAIERLTE